MLTWFSQLRQFDSALSAIHNANFFCCLAGLWSNRFHFVEHFNTWNNLSKNDVFAIEMRSRSKTEEELRSVRIWSSVGHWENSPSSVLVVEVLVLKFVSVDTFATSSISSGEIATLCHEPVYDPVEFAAFEVKRLAWFACSFFSRAESTEILGSFRGVFLELDFNPVASLSANCKLEEHFCHVLKVCFNKSIINHTTN